MKSFRVTPFLHQALWEAGWDPPVSGWEEHYFSLHIWFTGFCAKISPLCHTFLLPTLPAFALHFNLLQIHVEWEQWGQHRAGAKCRFKICCSFWDRNQRSSRTGASLPAAPTWNRGRKVKCVCSFLSPLAAFCRCLYLEITIVISKIKCASKGKFRLYEAIFYIGIRLFSLSFVYQFPRSTNMML